MNGARRLLFYDETYGRQIDVFIDTFEMCHVLPVGEHLERDPVTVPLADVLMTKLQIVELNAKDRSDVYALLLEHELGAGDASASTPRASPTSAQRLGPLPHAAAQPRAPARRAAGERPRRGDQRLIAERMAGIAAAVESEPKSVKWKARARVGERVRWYEEPDEVAQGGY